MPLGKDRSVKKLRQLKRKRKQAVVEKKRKQYELDRRENAENEGMFFLTFRLFSNSFL